MTSSAFSAQRRPPADLTAALCGAADVLWGREDGPYERISRSEARRRLGGGVVPLVCHARAVAALIDAPRFPALDVLELFAFVRPARFCAPTPRGLAAALLLDPPASLEEEARSLFRAMRALLSELAASPGAEAASIARAMAAGDWPWAPIALEALGARDGDGRNGDGLRVWSRLPEWEDAPPPPPPDTRPVEPVEARARLVQLLDATAEARPQQLAYASEAAAAFAPRDDPSAPRMVLLEGGTGIGKTLGYIAPATVWATKNRGVVWISTYTRNLQRQLDRELNAAYPDRRIKARKVVVRKGRENLLCLLNYEEAVARSATRREDAPPLGLVARWLLATRDGDMHGGDFPGWLADLLGGAMTVDLTDTRGECIHSACRHYRRCFIERGMRRARRADIVVANHALTMAQAAGAGDDGAPASRLVFDEGHHLFDAADSAFALRLSGLEARDLRLWICGREGSRSSRRRGLRERLGDLLAEDPAGAAALADAVAIAAETLPGAGWRMRLDAEAPLGPAESFLSLARRQVYARNVERESDHTLEAPTTPAIPGLLEAAEELRRALSGLGAPLRSVLASLRNLLDAEAERLDPASRSRIDGAARGLERRAILPLVGWAQMLRALSESTPPEFVDWFGVERMSGRDVDIALHRHWIDPTIPLVETVLGPAHGVLVTSATLRDAVGGDAEADWAAADLLTGAARLPAVARAAFASPFDYATNSRVVVVTDVARDDPRQVAAAYRELFLAAGGGALGLFTAIRRLRIVRDLIARPLEEAGLRLLAQHVDPLDAGTLIDIFRAEIDSCLLGTDAVRDGVDVPGRALRLIVFDRVPWPRPTLLHRVRRDSFGGRAYEEFLTRRRLKQAYGRLIRKADDRGAFVLLDRATPTRLAGAFPADAPFLRLGLADALAVVREMTAPSDRSARS